MERVDFEDIVRMNRAWGEVCNVHLNIGTGREVSILGLAELIGATVGFGGRLQGLGWPHRVELEEGVRRMYGWYVDG